MTRIAWLLLFLCACAAAGRASCAERGRYTASPEDYVRQFDQMIENRDRSEDQRLKRDPGPRMLGEKQVAGMLLLLKSKHWQAREFGCYVLGRRRAKAAIDALIALLSDESERVRERSAEALGRIGDPKAVDALLARLDHPKEMRGKRGSAARGQIALALGRLGEKRALRPLIAVLKDESTQVKRLAAAALGLLGEAAAGNAILPLLEERNRDVIRTAVISLGRLKCAAAVDGILPLLGHKDGRLRSSAAQALGRIGDRRAAPVLKAVMSRDKDAAVRAAAARALGKLGDRSVTGALRAALKDKDHRIATWAAKSLYDLGDPEGLKALLDIFSKGRETRKRHPVCDALAEMGEKAVPIVLEGLVDPRNRRLRENSAVAVRYVGAGCMPGVLKLLASPKPDARYAACRALSYFAYEPALKPLLALLGDARVGRTAGDALARLGRRAVPDLIAVARAGRQPALLNAIFAMERMRDHRLVPVLLTLTRHGEAPVRSAAAGALANQAHKDSLPAVVALLKDPENKVRMVVLELLARRPWARAYAPQVTPLLREKSVHVRRRAARALRSFGAPVAIPELQARLREEKDKRVIRTMEAAIEDTRKAEERREKEAAKREKRKKREAEDARKRREWEAKKHREEEERRKKHKPPDPRPKPRPKPKPDPKPKPPPGDEEPD
jgi:HEAT repeat protein